MIETKDKAYFEKAFGSLVLVQNIVRDEIVEALLQGKFERAKIKIENLQAVGVALQACDQTIKRFEATTKLEDGGKEVTEASPVAEEPKQ